MPGEVKVRKIEYKPEISLGFVAKAIYIGDWQLAGFDPIKGPIGQNIRDKKQNIILLNQNQNLRFYSLLCSFDCQHLFWRGGGFKFKLTEQSLRSAHNPIN